jgi:hypothetical protein
MKKNENEINKTMTHTNELMHSYLRSRDPGCQEFGDYLIRFGNFEAGGDLLSP